MSLSISPESLQRSAAELSDGLGELSGLVDRFAHTFDLGDMFGDNSPIATIGNPMYHGAMTWIVQCLRSLEGAIGDHSSALGAAASAFLQNEENNIGLSQQVPAAPAPAPGGAPFAPGPTDGAPAAVGPASDPHSQITVEATPEVKQWIAEARAIMIARGTDPALIDANDLAIIAMHESSGDPNAANDWDINAQNGTPSIGLMQTIQPTFDAHAIPGHTDIRNPVDNIIAASYYAIDRYGSVSDAPGPASVNAGGPYKPY